MKKYFLMLSLLLTSSAFAEVRTFEIDYSKLHKDIDPDSVKDRCKNTYEIDLKSNVAEQIIRQDNSQAKIEKQLEKRSSGDELTRVYLVRYDVDKNVCPSGVYFSTEISQDSADNMTSFSKFDLQVSCHHAALFAVERVCNYLEYKIKK